MQSFPHVRRYASLTRSTGGRPILNVMSVTEIAGGLSIQEAAEKMVVPGIRDSVGGLNCCLQAHATIGAGLSDTTKSMQEVVTALRLACIEISSESGKVHKAIDSPRRGLHSAFVDHQSTCR